METKELKNKVVLALLKEIERCTLGGLAAIDAASIACREIWASGEELLALNGQPCGLYSLRVDVQDFFYCISLVNDDGLALAWIAVGAKRLG